MSMNTLHAAGSVLALVLLAMSGSGSAPASAPGSAQTGTLAGRVEDSSGNNLPGAVVKLESNAYQQSRTLISNSEGRFRFISLPPAIYTLTAGHSGFRTSSLTDIVVKAGSTGTVVVTLSEQVPPEAGSEVPPPASNADPDADPDTVRY